MISSECALPLVGGRGLRPQKFLRQFRAENGAAHQSVKFANFGPDGLGGGAEHLEQQPGVVGQHRGSPGQVRRRVRAYAVPQRVECCAGVRAITLPKTSNGRS